jgi:glycosyltransferase involved in cell wall biosynthesis
MPIKKTDAEAAKSEDSVAEKLQGKKVAIVHDWLTTFGGAERVVHEFTKIFPDAPIYTSVYNEKNIARIFPPEKVRTSFMQKIPGAAKLYTKLLHLMPRAFEEFDLSDYDIVLSSSSSCAKGVLTRADTLHVSYVHTPMRYAWDLYQEYLRSSNIIVRVAMKRIMPKIRQWDALTGLRVDAFMANSHTTRQRIRKIYRRDAEVIFPPIDTDFYRPNGREPEDFYLVLSRFVPYKRIDIAIEACNKLGRRLVIIGDGGERKKLQAMAGPTIEFKGFLDNESCRDYYQRCRAFLFPGFEDFGMTPVETMACGRPVIAYGKGGVLDSVVPDKTGLFFPEQSGDSLAEAILDFEKREFDSAEIRRHAEGYSKESFRRQVAGFIAARYEEHQS